MSNPQSKAIKSLHNHGMKLISTPLQLQRGTLTFNDTKQPIFDYAIYGKSGYVRKRRTDAPRSGNGYWEWGGPRWWMINKVKTTPHVKGTYKWVDYERILTPGDFKGMAETIIRVSTKSRNKVN